MERRGAALFPAMSPPFPRGRSLDDEDDGGSPGPAQGVTRMGEPPYILISTKRNRVTAATEAGTNSVKSRKLPRFIVHRVIPGRQMIEARSSGDHALGAGSRRITRGDDLWGTFPRARERAC